MSTLILLISLSLIALEAPAGTAGCGVGGGTMLNRRTWAVYSADGRGDTMTFQMVVVARGRSRRSMTTSESVPRPAFAEADRMRFGGGGTVGRIWVLYDSRDNAIWIDTMQVRLGPAENLLLVDRIDGVGGPPVVLGRGWVAPINQDLCRRPEYSGQDLPESLRVRLDAMPDVRSFAETPR